MSNEEIAERIIDAWEIMENESMRSGHRHTLEQIIICTLENICFIAPNGDCLTPTCNFHK